MQIEATALEDVKLVTPKRFGDERGWFTEVYKNPPGTDVCGIHGTPETVKAKLEEMVGMGANHLMLNPVSCYREQVEILAEIVGFK